MSKEVVNLQGNQSTPAPQKENAAGWCSSTGPWMVTIPKASKLTGIPACEIRKLCKTGGISCYRAGNRYYVWIEEIKALLMGKTRRLAE